MVALHEGSPVNFIVSDKIAAHEVSSGKCRITLHLLRPTVTNVSTNRTATGHEHGYIKHIFYQRYHIFYLYSVGVVGIGGAGGGVVHSVSCVAARLVRGQPEQRPIALFKPKWVLLGVSEVILTFQSQASQGLSIQSSEFGVNSLPIVYVTQKGLELQAGAQTRCQTQFWAWERYAELRGRGAGDAASAVDAQTPACLQRFIQCPGPWGST